MPSHPLLQAQAEAMEAVLEEAGPLEAVEEVAEAVAGKPTLMASSPMSSSGHMVSEVKITLSFLLMDSCTDAKIIV